jgi:hypothetical protein
VAWVRQQCPFASHRQPRRREERKKTGRMLSYRESNSWRGLGVWDVAIGARSLADRHVRQVLTDGDMYPPLRRGQSSFMTNIVPVRCFERVIQPPLAYRASRPHIVLPCQQRTLQMRAPRNRTFGKSVTQPTRNKVQD